MSKKAIVNKVIARLLTLEAINPDLPDAINIYKNPFREVSEDELPCVKVAIMSGESERINNAPEYQHTDQLIIAYMAQGNDDDLEDELYDAAEAIYDFLIKEENNSGDAATLHHLISDLAYTGWDMDLKIGGIGTGAVVLKFDIIYHSKHLLEFGDLEGFEIEVKHTGAGENTDPLFVDSIDLPTE